MVQCSAVRLSVRVAGCAEAEQQAGGPFPFLRHEVLSNSGSALSGTPGQLPVLWAEPFPTLWFLEQKELNHTWASVGGGQHSPPGDPVPCRP